MAVHPEEERRRFVQPCWDLLIFVFYLFLIITLYLPAQPARGFALIDLLDKPWSQVSFLLPPRCMPSFFSRIGFNIPAFQLFMIVDFFCQIRTLTLSRFPLEKPT